MMLDDEGMGYKIGYLNKVGARVRVCVCVCVCVCVGGMK